MEIRDRRETMVLQEKLDHKEDLVNQEQLDQLVTKEPKDREEDQSV